MSKNSSFPQDLYDWRKIFWAFSFATIAALAISVIGDTFWPVLALLGAASVIGCFLIRTEFLFALVFLVIPFSIEYQIGGGFGTDLPTEPLIIGMAILTIVLFVQGLEKVPKRSFYSPIGLMLILHLFWIAITTLFAEDPVISFKFFLAKTWYFLPFYLLPFLFKMDHKTFRRIFDWFLVGVFISGVYFFAQHAREGLAFDARTNAGSPIFRNHVNYACLLVLSLPVLWYQYVAKPKHRLVYASLFLSLLVFVYFSYARVAYVCAISMVLAYVVIRYRLMKYALGLALAGVLVFVLWLKQENRYLDYAPEYSQTVTQYKFDDLLEATYRGEDISSMERIYRWMSGVNMIAERPLTGFGPGNFYDNYRAYTVTSFQTYVSDNPDKSGIHNYFLMTVVEQGVPGGAIFILLALTLLMVAETKYHRSENRNERKLVMTGALIVVAVLMMNTINDMFEVIKIGPVFFLACYILNRPDPCEKEEAKE